MLDTLPQAGFPSPKYESNGCAVSPLHSEPEAMDLDNYQQTSTGSLAGEDMTYFSFGDDLDIFDEKRFIPSFDQSENCTGAGDLLEHLCNGGKLNDSKDDQSDDDVDFVAIMDPSDAGKSNASDDENETVEVCDTEDSAGDKTPNIPQKGLPGSSMQPVIVVKRVSGFQTKATQRLPRIVCVQPGTQNLNNSKPPSVSVRNTRQKTVSPVCHDEDDNQDSQEPGKTSAAVQARLNRQKKKAYIEGLENQVKDLKTENDQLRSKSNKMKKDRDSLEEEVKYLRSVLANESSLSNMLSNIGNCQGVSLTSSFVNDRKRSASDMDHDYGSCSKRRHTERSAEQMSGGICLHVEGSQVSMEFCSKCARMAKEPEP